MVTPQYTVTTVLECARKYCDRIITTAAHKATGSHGGYLCAIHQDELYIHCKEIFHDWHEDKYVRRKGISAAETSKRKERKGRRTVASIHLYGK
jgi:hypothetical protein